MKKPSGRIRCRTAPRAAHVRATLPALGGISGATSTTCRSASIRSRVSVAPGTGPAAAPAGPLLDLPPDLARGKPAGVDVDVAGPGPQDAEEALEVARLQALLGDGADVVGGDDASDGAAAGRARRRVVAPAEEDDDLAVDAAPAEVDVGGGNRRGGVLVAQFV